MSETRDVIGWKSAAFPAKTLQEKVGVSKNNWVDADFTCNPSFLLLFPRQDTLTHPNRRGLYSVRRGGQGGNLKLN